MSSHDYDDYVQDKDVINKNAETPAERRRVFDVAVGTHWLGQDIGMIGRFEDGEDYFYALWKYPKGTVK
jgi:hypothetical protein